MLVFVGGVAYAWLHTFISYRIYHASLTRHISSLVILIRLLLSLTSTVLFAASKCPLVNIIQYNCLYSCGINASGYI